MLAVPMCLLYELGIFAARTLARPPDPAETGSRPAG
jgi:Sec-independent protein secretion pathway component TatC